ncbi:MAG: glycosyltransferase family A protein [Methylococcales bacterium]
MIVDDGSETPATSILRDDCLDFELRVIETRPSGPATARNLGAATTRASSRRIATPTRASFWTG